MKKIEHLGIAVSDITSANAVYEQLLGVAPYKEEKVTSEHVLTSFFRVGTNKLELLQATHPDSAIAKFIDKRGEGLHHVAFDVADIRAEMARLKEAGFRLLNKEPKQGADNKLICFV
ncbi:MAG: methylmalonyl-CoA/ethylmalonyl-CoA epimerase, partial [Saprospiraceae bacterium]